MTQTKKFLFWKVQKWLSYDDGGVDFFSFGRWTGCNFIHRMILRRM